MKIELPQPLQQSITFNRPGTIGCFDSPQSHLGDMPDLPTLIRTLRPVGRIAHQNGSQEITGVQIAFSQRIVVQTLDGNWHQMAKANVLPNYDTQILDSELTDRLIP